MANCLEIARRALEHTGALSNPIVTEMPIVPASSATSLRAENCKPELGTADMPVTELESAIPWAEWKAAALNTLFAEQGVTGEPGRITAATVQHGEKSLGKERSTLASR